MMSSQRRLLASSFLVLAAQAFTSPQVVAQGREVRLDEALGMARGQAIGVLRAAAQVEASSAAFDAVRDSRWPALSLDVGGGQRYGLSFDQTSGGLTQSTVESVDAGLSADVVVFDGFERRAASRSAEAGVRAAELTRARAEQEAAVAVLQGFLAVAQAEAARTVGQEDVAAQEALLAEVRAQVEFGARPGFEVSQQEERVATAQSAVLAAVRDRRLAEARLVRVLGLDPSEGYTFVAPEAPQEVPAEAAEVLVRRALESRTDLLAADAASEAAEADRRAARAGRLPRITAGAAFGTSYTSAAAVGFPSQVGDNRSGGIRVGVSVPLFDRGVARQRTRQADVRAVALAAEREDARRSVALDVRERLIELDALREQDVLAAVRVRAAEATLAAERARYAAGESTLQSVSLAQARAVEARTAQERVTVDARFGRLLLGVAVGA